MRREAFLKQLDYLLQDIDEKDRQDALDYYRDYMDEAGIDNADDVGTLLESPEQIAFSIRTSLNGNVDEQIEISEQGFKKIHTDEQPRVLDIYGNKEQLEDEHVSTEVKSKNSSKSKLILIIVTCIVLAPVILGIGGGLVGLVFGILGSIIGLIFGAAGVALGCIIGGVVLFVMSVIHMITSVPQGIFMMGAALLLIAVGILFAMLTVVIFKRMIPWIIENVRKLSNKLFRKDGGGCA